MTTDALRPEHRGYDVLPVPVAVLEGAVLTYANPAFGAFFGVPREAVIGQSVPALIDRLLPESERGWIRNLHERHLEDGHTLDEWWVKVLRGSRGQPLVRALSADGPRPGESVFLLLEADDEAAVREFTETLAAGTERLMRCLCEEEVYDTAVQLLFEQGLAAAVMLVEGDRLRHQALRQPEEQLRAAERIYGKPMTEVAFPLEKVPHVRESLRSRRAVFHLDFKEVVRPLHPPEVMAIIDTLPSIRAVDAPIIVGEEPLGIVTAMGPKLTPAMAASCELFARQIGAAVENARHHKLAQERLAQLTSLQAQLVSRERLSALGEAAAVLAHEVRNPLAAMFNALAMLKREPATSDRAGVLRMVDEEAQRLERVVEDLLDFTRPMAPKLARVELTEVAQQAVKVLKDRRELRDVRVELAASPDEHVLIADSHLLQLAIENLLRNAIQASPPGARVSLAVDRVNGHERVAVEDRGQGVLEQDEPRLFDPFFTTRAKGTGLGLSMVRRVAEAHGGNISFRRPPEGGARFELLLPRQPADRPG